jgi:error-prone DNA polymerase
METAYPYAPLHVGSCFSLGHGLLSPEQICREAKRRGHRAVGMVDRHNFYGMVRFLRAAGAQRIKPIVGMTLLRKGREACTAYVMDRRGFVALNRIVSLPGDPEPIRELLEHGWEGLAVVSGDPAVLRRLLARERRGLYVQLTYGRPFLELLQLARELDLPPLAVNQALFFEPGQAGLGDLLRSMSRGCTVEQLPRAHRIPAAARLVSRREMEGFFSAVPEALAAARAVAEEAECADLLSRNYVFPRYRDFSEAESFRMLGRLCRRGLAATQRRPGVAAEPASGVPLSVRKARLEHELGVIRRLGFAGYFLVVRDILRNCSLTCGRGSAAASLVSFLLGITHVDPLRHGLEFERFLNDQRSDPPDIDVDFPWDERDAVLRRVFTRYRGRAAMVANHVTYGPRSAVREAAKAFGLGEGEIERMVRFYRRGERELLPGYLLRAADSVRGLPRNLGTHCGGMVITPEPIWTYTHLRPSPLGYPLMAWDRDGAAAARLVKIDLLGNRSLSVLRDTLRNVGAGKLPEPEKVLGDPATAGMIARGDTLGLFYVESPACRQLLVKMGRGDYEHLILAGSIIRPAANATIRRFLRRLHGQPFRCPAPELQRSFGLMVYQEDIARVTAGAASFGPALADRLRRTLCSAGGSASLESYRRLFFSRGRGNGIPRDALEELWEMIRSFRGYSFCKAHSASYALVSYHLAYLKRHWPLEFFLSVINNGGGYYSRQTYLNHCRRLGIPLLPPDVNRSGIAYTAEEGGIRVGLGQILRISRSFTGRLIAERRLGGAFSSPEDFFRRLRPTLTETRFLVRCGALDGVAAGAPRPQLLYNCLRGCGRGWGQGQLFPPPPGPGGEYPEELKLLDELRTLGLMISRHPVALFRDRAERRVRELNYPGLIRSSELSRFTGREVSLVALVASGKEVIARPGSTGQKMVFITLEDEYSLFETVLFPPVYERFGNDAEGGGLLLLCGRVERDMGAVSVTVRRLSRLF